MHFSATKRSILSLNKGGKQTASMEPVRSGNFQERHSLVVFGYYLSYCFNNAGDGNLYSISQIIFLVLFYFFNIYISGFPAWRVFYRADVPKCKVPATLFPKATCPPVSLLYRAVI